MAVTVAIPTKTKERLGYYVSGISTGQRTLGVNNPDISTLKTALLERMYFFRDGETVLGQLPVEFRTINDKLKSFKNTIVKSVTATILSPEEFVDMYSGRKKTIYNNALDEYYETGVLKQHANSIAFVKCEKVNPSKAPRCIQPRHPVYNIGLGRYLKNIEHKIYKAIARHVKTDYVVMKGFNVNQIGNIIAGKMDKFAEPCFVGVDAKRFDMHVTVAMLQWEHSIYKNIYPKDKELCRLLKMQLKNKGAGYCYDGKLKYKVDGRRFSGDMNTALGNCLIMCGMLAAFLDSLHIRYELIDNGDDAGIIIDSQHLHLLDNLPDFASLFGFRLTIEEPVYETQLIEFCQMHPLRVANGWRMVRNIQTAREKDSISIIPLTNDTVMRKWLGAVGECGMAACSGIPIMQSLYSLYVRSGIKSKIMNDVAMASGMRHQLGGMVARHEHVMSKTRYDVYVAWGITPDEQVAIEKYYDTLTINYSMTPLDSLTDYKTTIEL